MSKNDAKCYKNEECHDFLKDPNYNDQLKEESTLEHQ